MLWRLFFFFLAGKQQLAVKWSMSCDLAKALEQTSGIFSSWDLLGNTQWPAEVLYYFNCDGEFHFSAFSDVALGPSAPRHSIVAVEAKKETAILKH